MAQGKNGWGGRRVGAGKKPGPTGLANGRKLARADTRTAMAAAGVPDVDVPMAALIAKAAVVAYQLLETGSESVKAALSSEIVCAELRRRSYVKVDTTVTHVSAAETLRLLDERLARLAPPTIEAEADPVPAPRPTTSPSPE